MKGGHTQHCSLAQEALTGGSVPPPYANPMFTPLLVQGKKEKKGKKKKDPTADRSVESLFAELVSNGILQPCPHVHVRDCMGSSSFMQVRGGGQGRDGYCCYVALEGMSMHLVTHGHPACQVPAPLLPIPWFFSSVRCLLHICTCRI